MDNESDVARDIAGPEARIKKHSLFSPIYEVTTRPPFFERAYQAAAKPLITGAVSLGMFLGSESICTNTAIAEEAAMKPIAPTTQTDSNSPLPKKMGAKIDAEYQPVSGPDNSHFGFSLFEIGDDGKPVFGDVARMFVDHFNDRKAMTNAGVRVPFDFGYRGKLALYGMEHGSDDGLGVRLSGSYDDWLLKGAFERLELGGKDQELKGLGVGRIFHSDLGKTTIEFWGYDKIGKKIGNIFLFQNFQDGYQGGVSFTGGDDSERNLGMSFGRFKGRESWRLHGNTALDGERFSIGGSFIIDPDPRFATTPWGYLNTEDGAVSYETLWKNAMGYYPYQRLFERGRLALLADLFHDEDSEKIITQASVRPFYFMGSDSELLNGIHIDGKYELNHSETSGCDDRLTGGAGILHKDLNIYFEKAERGKPTFGLQFIKTF